MSAPLAPDFRPRYHELHRVGRPGEWRSIVGALLLLVLVFGFVPLVAGGVFFAPLLPLGRTGAQASADHDVHAEATPAGLALLRGATWARAVGVGLAGLSMIAHFVWLPYQPVWSIVLIVVDGFIIWALCAPRRESPA